jgi:6,7-dimethyl-8-ribityllumazine synthase
VTDAVPPLRILLVEAPYYAEISQALAEGALAVLYEAGAKIRRIAVPGALEIPAAIRFALAGRWDGYVALGCVIRGETSHYDLVCNETARGVQQLALENGLAVGFGVLTVENEAQAWVRARRSDGDKGGHAARTCLAMIALRRALAVVSPAS